MTIDVTHGSSSVDLIPAAEDEAGLGVVHSEGLSERDRRRKEQRQAGLMVGDCEENIQPNVKFIIEGDQCFREKARQG